MGILITIYNLPSDFFLNGISSYRPRSSQIDAKPVTYYWKYVYWISRWRCFQLCDSPQSKTLVETITLFTIVYTRFEITKTLSVIMRWLCEDDLLLNQKRLCFSEALKRWYDTLERFNEWLKRRFVKRDSVYWYVQASQTTFVRGFVLCVLVFEHTLAHSL